MQNGNFYNTYSLPNNIGVIKGRKSRRPRLREVKMNTIIFFENTERQALIGLKFDIFLEYL